MQLERGCQQISRIATGKPAAESGPASWLCVSERGCACRGFHPLIEIDLMMQMWNSNEVLRYGIQENCYHTSRGTTSRQGPQHSAKYQKTPRLLHQPPVPKPSPNAAKTSKPYERLHPSPTVTILLEGPCIVSTDVPAVATLATLLFLALISILVTPLSGIAASALCRLSSSYRPVCVNVSGMSNLFACADACCIKVHDNIRDYRRCTLFASDILGHTISYQVRADKL